MKLRAVYAFLIVIGTSMFYPSMADADQQEISTPINLRIQVENNEVLLKWNNPGEGVTVERFAVMWQTSTSNGWAVATPDKSITLPMEIITSSAGSGTVYFSVRADNDTLHIYSGWSNQVTLEITPTAPLPSPTPTPTPSPTLSETAQPTPQPEPTQSPTPEPSQTSNSSPTPSSSPTPEASPSVEPQPTVTPIPLPVSEVSLPSVPIAEPSAIPTPIVPAEPEPITPITPEPTPIPEPEPTPIVEPQPEPKPEEQPAPEPEVTPEPKPIPSAEPISEKPEEKTLPPEPINGLIPNNPDSLPEDKPKVPESNLLKPHIQEDKAGVENGGIEFFGTKSQPQVIGEDGNLTPPPPAPGSGDPIPPDAITTADTFIGQTGGVTFNSPDIAVPVEPIVINIDLPGVGETAQAIADAYVAMANIGNDMSPITRKKAKKIIAATIVGGIITRRIK